MPKAQSTAIAKQTEEDLTGKVVKTLKDVKNKITLSDDFDALVAKYCDYRDGATKYEKQKSAIGAELLAALKAAKADSIRHADGTIGVVYSATLIQGSATEKLDSDLLKLNMGKFGLNAAQVSKIMEASTKKSVRKPSVTVTISNLK